MKDLIPVNEIELMFLVEKWGRFSLNVSVAKHVERAREKWGGKWNLKIRFSKWE